MLGGLSRTSVLNPRLNKDMNSETWQVSLASRILPGVEPLECPTTSSAR